MEDIKELRRRKRAYIELASVISDIRKYGYNEIDTKEFIQNIQFYNNLYPLPSGNIGNILAVALETNYYVPAKCILDNIEELGIDLNVIAYNNKKSLNYEEVFEYSKLTKMTTEELEQIKLIKGLIKTKKFLYRNEMAYLELYSQINKSKGMSL